MNMILSQIDPNLLSVTGVIATILAVIFALGAFTNSRSRKKHLVELEKAQRQEQAMHFRPAKSHLPTRSSKPSTSSVPLAVSAAKASIPQAAPLAKISTPPEKSSGQDIPEKQVLFRKVRLDGGDQRIDTLKDEDQELYVWE